MTEVDHVELSSILRSMQQKKWFILSIALIVFTFAMAYTKVKANMYQTNLLLQIQQKQQKSLGSLSQPGRSADAESAVEEPSPVQIALLRSKLILAPVIHALNLDISVTTPLIFNMFSKPSDAIKISELQLPNNYLKKKLHLIIDANNQYSLYDNNKLLIQGQAGKVAANNIIAKIKIDQLNAPVGTKFIVVKYPESEVLNKLLQNLKIIDISNSAEGNANKIGILQLSLTGNDPELIANTLNEIALVAQQINLQRKSLEAENKLAFLKIQLPIAKQSLETAEEKLNQYRSTTSQVDIKLHTHYLMAHLNELDKQLQELRVKKSELLQQYTAHYPFVRTIDGKINELNKLRNEIYNELKKMPAADQSASAIHRDINVKNALYLALSNQIHESEVAKKGIISDIHVLVKATTPEMPIIIRPSIIGIASLMIGLILGCMLVLGFKIISRRIDDPNWIEKAWHIKNLAVVPHSKQQKKMMKAKNNQSLLAFQFPNDKSLESLCYLRTYLQHNCMNSANNIISIMGVAQRVGKTFIAANLAGLLARVGLRVLLIDCDIRDRRMQHYFNHTASPGLTDVLTGKAELEQALVKLSTTQNLHFLPCGAQSAIPTDLFASIAFKSLLEEVSKQYQFVLINSSASIYPSECMLIGSLAGMNLLVAGVNQHKLHDFNSAIKQLKQIGLEIHGSIFSHIIAV